MFVRTLSYELNDFLRYVDIQKYLTNICAYSLDCEPTYHKVLYIYSQHFKGSRLTKSACGKVADFIPL